MRITITRRELFRDVSAVVLVFGVFPVFLWVLGWLVHALIV